LLVDAQGQPRKSFHIGITGVASHLVRADAAKRQNDESMRHDVPEATKQD
jgi:hypothetical protein